jgi:hypothetical protein
VASADEINQSKLSFISFYTNISLYADSSLGLQQLVRFIFRTITDYKYITAMRVKWAKTKAHADQWGEEVILVPEEMRWTICFLDWKASWWLDLRSAR